MKTELKRDDKVFVKSLNTKGIIKGFYKNKKYVEVKVESCIFGQQVLLKDCQKI